ncbi:unnamed protein product [Pedinophyceae sp. YPF-701]|nr:unnamed protein product [Pedinophyceae sp. YPF-701]
MLAGTKGPNLAMTPARAGSVADSDAESPMDRSATSSPTNLGKKAPLMLGSMLSPAERAALQERYYGEPGMDDGPPELKPLSSSIANADPAKGKLYRATWGFRIPSGALSGVMSWDDRVAAVASRDGTVTTFAADKGNVIRTIRLPGANKGDEPPACTCLRFRPEVNNPPTKNVVAVGRANKVTYVHTTTGRVLTDIAEVDNSVLAVEFDPTGSKLATAGTDRTVRVYDDARRTVETELANSDNGKGHSNNVFALSWDPRNPALVVSAGWDNTMLLWDIRTPAARNGPVQNMFGVYCCGPDGVQFTEQSTVLAASWRKHHPLQVWDLRKGQLVTNFVLTSSKHGEESVKAYAARWGQPGSGCAKVMAAGGGGEDLRLARIFHKDGFCHGTFPTMSPVLSIALSKGPTGKRMLVCSDAEVAMLELDI